MSKLFQTVENGDGIPSSIVTASGTISINTTLMRGIIRHVLIKAATSTTTFDVKFIDRKSRVVKHYMDEEGTLNDFPVFPVEGVYTITIENASNDEAFEVMFVVES